MQLNIKSSNLQTLEIHLQYTILNNSTLNLNFTFCIIENKTEMIIADTLQEMNY